jgi:hypothetical protein
MQIDGQSHRSYIIAFNVRVLLAQQFQLLFSVPRSGLAVGVSKHGMPNVVLDINLFLCAWVTVTAAHALPRAWSKIP